MFIKLNGNVINSVSIRKIDIEPFNLKPFEWRVWAYTTTEEKVSLGTFLNRGDAKYVLDYHIYPHRATTRTAILMSCTSIYP